MLETTVYEEYAPSEVIIVCFTYVTFMALHYSYTKVVATVDAIVIPAVF